MKYSWIKDNITSVIGCLIILQATVIDILVLLRQVKTTETNTTIILQNSNAMAMLVLGYYFVSSKGKPEPKNDVKVEGDLNIKQGINEQTETKS